MRSNLFFLGFCFLLMISCKDQEARRPITATKTYTLASVTEDLKKINKKEETKVLAYIKKDTANTYSSSSSGYWFYYQTKIEEELPTPKVGDIVELTYEILDLNNQPIYTKEELGIKQYKVDKEDFIPALQDGVKNMKIGETIKFLIPAYNAYGIVGDENKIGINKSIISILTLINIKENPKNED